MSNFDLRTSKRWLSCALVALIASVGFVACAHEAAPASEPAVLGVTHVHLEGPIDAGSLSLVARGIRAAKSRGDKTLVLEIDTPGGRLDSLWQIQKQLVTAAENGLSLVAWVHNHAASAGTLVALSCERIYISSVGTIGSAMPVTMGETTIEELPEGIREKEVSFLRAQFASAAEKYGRSGALAQATVDRDTEVRQVKIDGELQLVTGDQWTSLRERGANFELVRTVVERGKLLNLTARDAVELRFADGIADTLAQVLDKRGLSEARVTGPLERSNADEFVVWIERLMPLLLIAALILAYVEIKLPGFGIPGILSIVCFALLLAGQYMAGLADIPHIVAVTAGAILIAIEVFVVPGSLWLGIVGIVLVVGGLILGSVGPNFDFTSAFDKTLVVEAAFRVLGSATVALIGAFLLSRVLPKTPLLRRMVLVPSTQVAAFAGAMPETQGAEVGAASIGALGTVVTALRPVGKVELDARPGYEWEARSDGPLLMRGERVRVVEVSAARLVVVAFTEAKS